MSIVTAQNSKTYIIRKESEAETASACSLALSTAENYHGKVLKQEKLKNGAYLLVMNFSDKTLIKDWETRTGISSAVPTSKIFIVSDESDDVAMMLCSKAKDQATKAKGTILMERKLDEGIYMLTIFFEDQSLMEFWQSSLGVR